MHFIKGVIVCVCCCHACLLYCLCVCSHKSLFSLLFPSIKTSLQKSSLTAAPHIPQSLLPTPPPLPTLCPSQASQHPSCWNYSLCVRRHCGKSFPPSHLLYLPFLFLLIFFSFRYRFGWVQAEFILMFIKWNNCPCNFCICLSKLYLGW